jgi:hypothetical protein
MCSKTSARFPRASPPRNQPEHLEDQRANNSLQRRRVQARNRGIQRVSQSILALRDPSSLTEPRNSERQFFASVVGPWIDLLRDNLSDFSCVKSQTDSSIADGWMYKRSFDDGA